ncbi:hypothetical protein [Burkholderia gladioli]|uniref:hypothetical protein n=1 Tax=Burkholderia gladioli TaxID=28095 RepID=UPI000CFFEF01|nr:hypothetical protein [Burkholderia gladioli]PRH33398.1 hypothetical protein C6V07_23495 [Burkholderia gladioli]
MRGITGYKLKQRIGDRFPQRGDVLPDWLEDAEARDRVVDKVRALGQGFFEMSERDYRFWSDHLPEDEFVELIALMIKLAHEPAVNAAASRS